MVTLNKLQQKLGLEETIEDDRSFFGRAFDKADEIAKNFNVGLARTLGIPRAIEDISGKFRDKQFATVGIEPSDAPSVFPTGERIQELGSKVGATFPPGEQPETLIARTIQNVGSAAPILPFLPLTVPILATEGIASFTAAVGGKILEGTEFGQSHPEVARAIGELGGGIGGVFTVPLARFLAKGGSVGTVLRFLKNLIPGAEKRGLSRIKNIEFTPKKALEELERMETIPEGKFLLPGQATGTSGVARLTKTVEEEVPRVGAIIERRRIRAVNELQKQFNKSGDIADARNLLEEKLVFRSEQASTAMGKIKASSDPTALSNATERSLSIAERESNEVIKNLWARLPKGTKVRGENLSRVMREELENITEGGSINQISSVARQKLGRLNKEGKLIGGKLFSESKGEAKQVLVDVADKPIIKALPGKLQAEAKAVHQFYSLLGFEKARLGRIGGQGNKIRIINRLREAALDDLDGVVTKTGVSIGDEYRKTLQLTREFHDKFTKGAIGRILGRARGETPSPVASLEDIVGSGGVQAKESILQALKASPQTKTQIEDFLKFQFGVIAKNTDNNKINVNAGNAFIKKFGNILDDIFPELKRDLQDAIAKQKDVDAFIGVGQVSGSSPLVKEKTAAGFFLGADPGGEMAALMRNTTLKRTTFLDELVKLTKSDPTGNALKGLKNGFTEELLKHGNIDDITKLSGTKIISRLKELEKSVIKSGLFSSEEYNKLKRIGDVFKKIEIEKGAKRFPEGIISDPVSKALALPLRWIAARVGGRTGGSIGGSLQIANQAVKESQAWARGFTNDGAKNILIRFVLDKQLAKDMLTDVTKLNRLKRGELFTRMSEKVKDIVSGAAQGAKEGIPRTPITAIAPAAGSIAAGITNDPIEESSIKDQLKQLLKQ